MNQELLDIMIGRHSCWERERCFPVVDDAIAMGTYAIEGYIIWVVQIQKALWNEVRLGEAHLDPKLLFRGYVN